MVTEDLHDLASTVAIKGKALDANGIPLTRAEISAVMRFCRDQICDADVNHAYRLFYNHAYDILAKEVMPDEKRQPRTKNKK